MTETRHLPHPRTVEGAGADDAGTLERLRCAGKRERGAKTAGVDHAHKFRHGDGKDLFGFRVCHLDPLHSEFVRHLPTFRNVW